MTPWLARFSSHLLGADWKVRHSGEIGKVEELCDRASLKDEGLDISKTPMSTHFVSDVDISGSNWSNGEIDLIVADYFDMFRLEFAGLPFNKAERNRALQKLIGRGRGSIEFKHQNISAVLLKLGYPWISGYKPMANFQGALIDGIERHLNAVGPLLSQLGAFASDSFPKSDHIIYEPPPKLVFDDTHMPLALRRLVRKFDPAIRDDRNRALGLKGEEKVFEDERRNLISNGLPDLARRVRWVSQEDGDGAGYDILSYTFGGQERLLEVKTTVGDRATPFFLSYNEKCVSDERPDSFRLIRVYDFARSPRAFELLPPLEQCVALRPQIYRASFNA